MVNQTELQTRAQEILDFVSEIDTERNLDVLNKKGNEFIYSFSPDVALQVAARISWLNPFFLPDIPQEHFVNLQISPEQFAGALMRTRMTINRNDGLNILVACAPKSASTFMQTALRKGLGLGEAGLTVPAANSSALGANMREQEFDELAVIRSGLTGTGYVAQHHMRMNPYAALLLKNYNIKPIVMHRNILDTLVSLDDMFMSYREEFPEHNGHYFNDALPEDYATYEQGDRLAMVAHRHASWLVNFYVSWKRGEAHGMVKPLWISYEDDILGDKKRLTARVLTYLGLDRADPVKMVSALMDRSGGKSVRINKAVSGRGSKAPESVREFVLSVARPYENDVDISPLIT